MIFCQTLIVSALFVNIALKNSDMTSAPSLDVFFIFYFSLDGAGGASAPSLDVFFNFFNFR